MHESVERTEEGGVHLGQFTGKGYNINKEKEKGVHEGSIIRSQLEKNKNTTGHSEGPLGWLVGVCKGPARVVYVFLPGAWNGAGQQTVQSWQSKWGRGTPE